MRKRDTIWLAVMVGMLVFLATPAISQWMEISVNKIKQADTTKSINLETDGDGVRIGSSTVPGSAMSQIRSYVNTLTPSAISAATCAGGAFIYCSTTETFTVTGLATTDKVFVNPPHSTNWPSAGMCPAIGYNVSATDTLRIRFAVWTTAACTPTAGVYNIFAIRAP